MIKLKSALRSIAAMVAGYIVSAVLTGVTIAILGLLFPASYQPENIGWVIFNVVYGGVFAVVGGYITARMAPSHRLGHALTLGVLMALMAVVTGYAVSATPPSPEYINQPGWYYPVLAVTVLPSMWFGGWLRVRGESKLSATV